MAYPLCPGHGRVGDTSDIRPLTTGSKGRVERAAGTFQDRLVTDLRLAGVSTIDQANLVLKEFLLRFNEKFGVPAEQPKIAYRPLESSATLAHILSYKHRRKVARDNTVQYKNRTLQLLPSRDRPSFAGPTWRCWNRATVSSWCDTERSSSQPKRRPSSWPPPCLP